VSSPFPLFLPSCTTILVTLLMNRRSLMRSTELLPQTLVSSPFSLPALVSYKEAVCFAFPAFFLVWMRLFSSCKFARISSLPSLLCGSLDAVDLLCGFSFPVRSRLSPATPPPSPACCIVNLIHRRPSFCLQWFMRDSFRSSRSRTSSMFHSSLDVELTQAVISNMISFLTS